MISLIVAHDAKHVIGKDNAMPWHLPGDLQYFKAQTIGKPVIMGRKTFESIGRPLPGRRNIVITRNRAYEAEGIETVGSLQEALSLTREADEQMIIGGEQIFTEALPLADRLYITHIDTTFEGDTFFPQYPQFTLVHEQPALTAQEGFTFRYCIYEKTAQ
ncbi:MAG: dihydrofolate reductase [Caryophanon sp.]|nr:dihydrofolate reductase [Caryophanon sp.]